jgi:hypothetical protein
MLWSIPIILWLGFRADYIQEHDDSDPTWFPDP